MRFVCIIYRLWNQESPSQDSGVSSWYSKDKMLEMRLPDGLRGRLCLLPAVDGQAWAEQDWMAGG